MYALNLITVGYFFKSFFLNDVLIKISQWWKYIGLKEETPNWLIYYSL